MSKIARLRHYGSVEECFIFLLLSSQTLIMQLPFQHMFLCTSCRMADSRHQHTHTHEMVPTFLLLPPSRNRHRAARLGQDWRTDQRRAVGARRAKSARARKPSGHRLQASSTRDSWRTCTHTHTHSHTHTHTHTRQHVCICTVGSKFCCWPYVSTGWRLKMSVCKHTDTVGKRLFNKKCQVPTVNQKQWKLPTVIAWQTLLKSFE